MKKILYENATLHMEENNEEITLQYFLLENEIEIEGCNLKCYGFEIVKTSHLNSLNLKEVKQIPNVFFKRHEASMFLKKISQMRVTPITLAGILEDYISEAISEKRIPMMV